MAKELKKISKSLVRIFKIKNRKGYASLCKDNLTEGSTPLQAYERMQKAVKRMGLKLEDLKADEVKKLVK